MVGPTTAEVTAVPDLLAHALLAYAVCRLLSLRIEWFTTPYVTAGMAGAFVPDVMKVRLLVTGPELGSLLGIPFSWDAIGTLGGATVCVLVGVALVAPDERRRAGSALAVGAATHLATDAMLLTPSGRSFPVFWPLTRYSPPTPGLYLSTRPEPTAVAAALAVGSYLIHRRIG